MKRILLSLAAGLAGLCYAGQAQGADTISYWDHTLPLDIRVNDLVSRMTLQEKVSQMMHGSPAVERLGIPAYNWWNECLHGVGRSGDKVTVFPQAIGMAATFNPEALERTGEIISTEARAVYNGSRLKGEHGKQYKGLTFWTPNINIFRDPRWGRGQETYGEDPYLTAIMGTAMVNGLQGNDPTYLKSSACAKHYAVHSGPEPLRHVFDVTVSPHDLWDTYMPAFRTLVVDANVSSVMCAYNRYEGQPCCASDDLMRKILLYEWGFEGYVTGDCWAINDFWRQHKTHPDAATSSADAVLHGTDLDCGTDYRALVSAVERGLITEEQIDISLKRLMKTRFRLGQFDPENSVPYNTIPYSILEAPEHQAQALLMARQSMVLLKNNKQLLPLSPKKVKTIALFGPNADNEDTQLGNYNGFPTDNVTILKALQREGYEVIYHPATDLASRWKDGEPDEELLRKAAKADLVIFAGGISPRLEGEAGDAGNDEITGFVDGDRSEIELPSVQTEFMKKLKAATGKPLVFVNMSGSAVAFRWEAENADAIIQAWYGGQATGTAVADVLFGRYNPSGRLPVTFYKSTNDLPDFESYDMSNRTYRYFNGEVLYPFGYGLSFNTYSYDMLDTPKTLTVGNSTKVKVEVRNRGKYTGEEVVQLYVSNREIAEEAPICALKGVQRVTLKPGERKTITFDLSAEQLGYIDNDGEWTQKPGKIKIWVGGRTPNAPDRFGKNIVSAQVEVVDKQ